MRTVLGTPFRNRRSARSSRARPRRSPELCNTAGWLPDRHTWNRHRSFPHRSCDHSCRNSSRRLPERCSYRSRHSRSCPQDRRTVLRRTRRCSNTWLRNCRNDFRRRTGSRIRCRKRSAPHPGRRSGPLNRLDRSRRRCRKHRNFRGRLRARTRRRNSGGSRSCRRPLRRFRQSDRRWRTCRSVAGPIRDRCNRRHMRRGRSGTRRLRRCMSAPGRKHCRTYRNSRHWPSYPRRRHRKEWLWRGIDNDRRCTTVRDRTPNHTFHSLGRWQGGQRTRYRNKID